jgi:L-cysteine/cystine lyase
VAVNLEAVRAGLPVLQRVAYLNAGTFGPLPRRTTEAMIAQLQAELAGGRSGAGYWEHVRALRASVRAAIAGLIGASPEAVALTRSTSEGCTIAVAGLRLRPDDEIVTTDDEHFGLLAPLHASGARVRVACVRGRPVEEAFEAIEAEIGERTRLIAVSHVTWTTGRVLPVRALAGNGIPVLVDGAQGAGAVPVDVRELGCDFYTVSGQKWLLGPDGTGALYVRPQRVDELAVALPSYFSQQAYEPTGAFVPTPGAARFDPGSIPAPSLAGVLESIAFAQEAGEDRFARAREMAERLRSLLAERFDVLTEPDQATLVSFRPGRDPEQAVAALAARGVVVRGFHGLDWIRASVGFWTSDGDLERLLDGLASL